MKGLPGGYKVGQVVTYRNWQSLYQREVSADDESALTHIGRITGFNIRDEQFYYIVEYRGMFEEVKPDDIEF